MMKKTRVFTAGEGAPCYRIPGLVQTQKGTVLVYCETRGSGDDWDAHGIAVRAIAPDGTVSPLREIISLPGQTVNNPVMIARRDGGVTLLFLTDYRALYQCESTDDGQTFSAPRALDVLEGYRVSYDWTCAAVGPGHGIETRGGLLVVPVWLARGEGKNHFPSVVSDIVSRDGGKTWLRGDLVTDDGADFQSPNETGVAELSDGTLYYTLRHRGEARVRYAVRSADGLAFTRPQADYALPDPRCFGAVAARGENTYLVCCATPGRRRILLTARKSADGGKTWGASRLIAGGQAGYADLIALRDGTLMCLYEEGMRGSADVPASLTLAAFDDAFLCDAAAAERDLYAEARAYAADMLAGAGIVITDQEREKLEIADMGLGRLTETGLLVLTYINTARCCAKELILFPGQTCPEHRHPTLSGVPGKEETFRCRAGLVYLYVPGAGGGRGVPPRGDEKYYTADTEIVLAPGEQYTIWPDTPHWFKAGPDGAVVSEFSTSSHDETDIFKDVRIARAPKQL